jgi:tRNA-specific 2-thiouridylase
LCKLRHGPELTGCDIEWIASARTIRVTLDEPDRGVAPGQFAVFYDGEVCLGSGKILEENPR